MSLASSLQVCNIDMDSTSDQHHQWLQATMHENSLMNSSSSSPGRDMLGPSQILMSERRLRPPQDQSLKCPRCDSTHTKFCYYNNYSLTQPRYFCKTCRRYWTKGGTLRNIPVGGGYRKNRKSSTSSSNKKLTSNDQPLLSVSSSIINNQNPNPNTMMMTSLVNPVDLQLSFPFSQLQNSMMMMTSSGGNNNIAAGVHDYLERENTLFNKSILMHHDMNSPRLIRPIDHLCMEYKQNDVVENTSKSNNYEGYINLSSTQFAGGYDHMQINKGSIADHLGLSNCYIDENNNNNTNESVAQYHVTDEYYSGLLHEQHHYNNKDVITQMMQCEAKPNLKRLGLEWQQEAVGSCPDENRFNSKEETFGGHDNVGGSWWGSMSSNAGNIYQHHQMILPSATTSNNNSLH